MGNIYINSYILYHLSLSRPLSLGPSAQVERRRRRVVDVHGQTAWVGSGTMLGEVYYAIANKTSRLGFPGSVGLTVGISGYLSGAHGLASDHVLDATMVDTKGRLLDRAAMEEDLFWAIRGGGGGNFGIVLSWKLRLVPVPATVTVFTVHRSRNQSATNLLIKWQRVAPSLPSDTFLRVVVPLYLGTRAGLVAAMADTFPELNVTVSDCTEMTWIQSVLYFVFYSTGKPSKMLLDRGNGIGDPSGSCMRLARSS
uniref:FAD-binding PCMH-type domain-containing protein n=2 Tax=Oryza TaxID=4527 RepID=A0A0D9Y8W7_9ORYZ